MSVPVLPPRQRAAFAAVIQYPESNAHEIARLADMPPGTAAKAMSRLERLSLVQSRWDGRYRTFTPAPEVIA